MKSTQHKLDNIFHPIEHAIIRQWLGIKHPDAKKNINVLADDNQLPEGVVGLETDMYGALSDLAVPNAVARIVLSTIQADLPQWSAISGDQIIYGRKPFKSHKSKISMIPQLLFQINWATSGPGFPWPVEYHVGFLPYYDIYVVTSSADSPEAFGYLDLALGWFGVEGDVVENSKRVIQADWQHQFNEFGQPHWEAVWGTGLISEEQVEEMAENVWGKQTQEEFYDKL